LVEFTGERVVPGQVNDDLWNEHIARYTFAAQHAQGKRVLDAGCGTGYGSAELAQTAASVAAIDIAPEAVEFARQRYSRANLQFAASSCIALPFPAKAFDLIVAFEVIEHLADYRGFLDECNRALADEGLFLVSSPNKRYYAESRAKTGPNPYHHHEFEPEEFLHELSRVFTNVRLLLQDRLECFAFYPCVDSAPADTKVGSAAGDPGNAHFLIGLCSRGSLPETRSFVYVPQAANLLREREQHIQLLEQELARTKDWLRTAQAERDSLLELFREQKDQLEASNRWAQDLGAQLDAAGKRVVEVQNEAEALAAAYRRLEEESQATTDWALNTSQQLESKSRELAECVRLLDAAETTVVERTLWAQRLEAERQKLIEQLNFIRASRWLKLGRKVGLGPELNQD